VTCFPLNKLGGLSERNSDVAKNSLNAAAAPTAHQLFNILVFCIRLAFGVLACIARPLFFAEGIERFVGVSLRGRACGPSVVTGLCYGGPVLASWWKIILIKATWKDALNALIKPN
jgi:hypothetical protein